ncbi:Hypothetical predicted protein [Marmota monax]|uniref:Uncharacterized protein n=1 Tax=Marmota monax TaxID=9995 RepID=A0A5E4CG70_MARMO|nr:Hypothetical predicted protein [Marmota monax]
METVRGRSCDRRRRRSGTRDTGGSEEWGSPGPYLSVAGERGGGLKRPKVPQLQGRSDDWIKESARQTNPFTYKYRDPVCGVWTTVLGNGKTSEVEPQTTRHSIGKRKREERRKIEDRSIISKTLSVSLVRPTIVSNTDPCLVERNSLGDCEVSSDPCTRRKCTPLRLYFRRGDRGLVEV